MLGVGCHGVGGGDADLVLLHVEDGVVLLEEERAHADEVVLAGDELLGLVVSGEGPEEEAALAAGDLLDVLWKTMGMMVSYRDS